MFKGKIKAAALVTAMMLSSAVTPIFAGNLPEGEALGQNSNMQGGSMQGETMQGGNMQGDTMQGGNRMASHRPSRRTRSKRRHRRHKMTKPMTPMQSSPHM